MERKSEAFVPSELSPLRFFFFLLILLPFKLGGVSIKLPPGALVPLPKQPTGSCGFNAWTRSACLLCISSLMGAPLGGIYFSLQWWRIFHLPLLFARCTIERRRTSRPAPVLSPPTARRSPAAIFAFLLDKLCFFPTGKEGSLSTGRQTGRERVDTPALLSFPCSFPHSSILLPLPF